VRSGATAAFAVDVEGRERLVIVSEVERRDQNDWNAIIGTIRREVLAAPATIALELSMPGASVSRRRPGVV
jgi:hypothetical protein